jgi:hypothetical protein
MRLRTLATLVLTILALAAPATAGVNTMNPRGAPTSETRIPPAKSNPAPRATRGSPNDEQRYKAREAKAKNAKKYRAGDTVVIGVTTAIIILLGIIIIILIT